MGTAAGTKITKGSNRTNSIGNFFVDKVDVKAMLKFLKLAEVPKDKVDRSLESEPLAVALSLYFRETVAEDDLCKCEVCGGEADASITTCPFCGLASEVDATDTSQLAAAVAAEEPTKSKKKNAPEETPKAKETTMPGTTHVNGKSNKSAALATIKGGKTPVVHTPEVVLTAKDLDEAVKRVVNLKSMAATSYWALGNELRAINENKLWKLRVGKDSKARYTSFDQFAEQEIGLSHTYAYNLIDIAKTFSEKDVKEFGTSRLTLMLKVAPEDRPHVREVAKTASKRALAKEVEAVKAKRGHGAEKSAKHAAAGKAGAKATAAKTAKSSDKITIAQIEGKKTVKLFAKPDSIRNVDFSTLKRAKTIDAQPFGKLELTNEVTMLFSLVKTDNGLELIINTRRDVSE